ncbi:MAG: L,D-transpeptidase family protein [Roseburia sp.]|nr:L,D-transpeptidase family protein [Roseburia sp.]
MNRMPTEESVPEKAPVEKEYKEGSTEERTAGEKKTADAGEAADVKEASKADGAADVKGASKADGAADVKEASKADGTADVKETSETDEKKQGEAKELSGSQESEKSGKTAASNAAAAEQNSEEPLNQPAKRHSVAKKVFLTALALVILLTAGYFGTAVYYRSHFLPNTSIDGISCGNMEIAEVVPLIDAKLQNYTLTVTGRDYRTGEPGALLGEIRAADVALAYENTTGAVTEVFEQQNALLWPQAYLGSVHFTYSLAQGVQFDGEQLRQTTKTWDACQKKNMIEPADAYISEYLEEKNSYEVIPEAEGTELNMEAVYQCLENGLYAHASSLDLEELQCYTTPSRDRTDRRLTETVETANRWLGTKVVYDWNENEVILDSELLKDWITIDQEEPVLDEEAVRKFVKEQAGEYDTYGKRKSFVTALGITLKLRSPNYGWKTDVETETAELVQLIRQGGQIEREPAYSVKAVKKGENDIGESYVEADLTHQHLYVYEKGEVVLETDFVSGKMNSTPGCVTPEGIYGLTYKTTNATLRGADYESHVDYWMPFYGNYGMHDAQWRKDFGGTIYREHGSHGCINLPLEAAAVIYNYVYSGSPVICYYYEVDPLAPTEETTLTEEELRSQEEPTLSQQTEQSQPSEPVQ